MAGLLKARADRKIRRRSSLVDSRSILQAAIHFTHQKETGTVTLDNPSVVETDAHFPDQKVIISCSLLASTGLPLPQNIHHTPYAYSQVAAKGAKGNVEQLGRLFLGRCWLQIGMVHGAIAFSLARR
jgi:hypothetical protein